MIGTTDNLNFPLALIILSLFCSKVVTDMVLKMQAISSSRQLGYSIGYTRIFYSDLYEIYLATVVEGLRKLGYIYKIY